MIYDVIVFEALTLCVQGQVCFFSGGGQLFILGLDLCISEAWFAATFGDMRGRCLSYDGPNKGRVASQNIHATELCDFGDQPDIPDIADLAQRLKHDICEVKFDSLRCHGACQMVWENVVELPRQATLLHFWSAVPVFREPYSMMDSAHSDPYPTAEGSVVPLVVQSCVVPSKRNIPQHLHLYFKSQEPSTTHHL